VEDKSALVKIGFVVHKECLSFLVIDALLFCHRPCSQDGCLRSMQFNLRQRSHALKYIVWSSGVRCSATMSANAM
jgi:hypothetical protein